jgi:hypothetical protein
MSNFANFIVFAKVAVDAMMVCYFIKDDMEH